MKKRLIIILTIITVFILGGISIFFYPRIDATIKVKEFYEKIKDYKLDEVELKTGVYIDFKTDKNPVTKTKFEEGQIFVDANKEVKTYSNIKINGFYCTENNGKIKCDTSNKKDTNVSLDIVNDEYKIGDLVYLSDGRWRVINESSNYSSYVTLIREERIDINNDEFTMTLGSDGDPDLIAFDSGGSKEYDVTREGNIGYYLENDYKKTIDSGGDVIDIRLLTYEEIIKIKEIIGFETLSEEDIYSMYDAEEEVYSLIGLGHDENAMPYYEPIKISYDLYEKLMPHWLFNSFSGNYWILSNDDNLITTVWDGNGYGLSNATDGAGLKPVITIRKDSIIDENSLVSNKLVEIKESPYIASEHKIEYINNTSVEFYKNYCGAGELNDLFKFDIVNGRLRVMNLVTEEYFISYNLDNIKSLLHLELGTGCGQDQLILLTNDGKVYISESAFNTKIDDITKIDDLFKWIDFDDYFEDYKYIINEIGIIENLDPASPQSLLIKDSNNNQYHMLEDDLFKLK